MVRMNKNLSLKDRNTYVFDNFRGVDFSTSPYYVAKNRASYAENLLYENGTLRKRKGFKSLCKITNSDGKALRINGLFNFKINNEEIILCYAGTYFYILKWNNNLEKYDAEEIECFSNNLIDDKINLYVNNNKAFIVGCGDYLML
ncbi:MAG: hypothetical protein IJW82_07530 [Clostridia bacterium]|nr:hypothetical protein [Clostridia bacterium]